MRAQTEIFLLFKTITLVFFHLLLGVLKIFATSVTWPWHSLQTELYLYIYVLFSPLQNYFCLGKALLPHNCHNLHLHCCWFSAGAEDGGGCSVIQLLSLRENWFGLAPEESAIKHFWFLIKANDCRALCSACLFYQSIMISVQRRFVCESRCPTSKKKKQHLRRDAAHRWTGLDILILHSKQGVIRLIKFPCWGLEEYVSWIVFFVHFDEWTAWKRSIRLQ